MSQHHRNASNRRAVVDTDCGGHHIVPINSTNLESAACPRICHSLQVIHCSCDGGSFAASAIDPCCQGRATSKRAAYTQAMIHNPQSLNVCEWSDGGRLVDCGFEILTCEPEQEPDPRPRSPSFRPRPRLTSASGSYLVLLLLPLLPPPTLKNPLIASFTREKKFPAKIKELENHRWA